MTNFAYLGPSQDSEEALLEHLFLSDYPTLAVDVETVSLKDRTLIGIGISPNPNEAFYFPVLPEPSAYLDSIWELLEDTPKLKVFHNAIFDLGVLDIEPGRFADTSIMLQMQALPLRLADTVGQYLGVEIKEISDILPARKTMLDVPVEVVAEKCLHDTLYTHKLFEQMGGRKWLDKANGHTWTYQFHSSVWQDMSEPTSYYVSPEMKDCYDVDIRLIPLLLRMSKRGLALRKDRVEEWYEELSKEKLFYQDICTQYGFNPGSNQQVGYTLAERGNILPFTRSRRQLKVDEDVLLALDDPLARVVLQYRKKDKLLGTYIKPWRGEERAYTNFRLDLGTGRLASYDRNLQNVPKPVRDIFEPDSGVWTWWDHNQIEMRMFAYITQDPMMLKAYREGSDIHTVTQISLWPGSDLNDETLRVRVKGFNFSMIFYAQVETISRNSGLPLVACKKFREEWLDLYEVAADYMVRQMEGTGPTQTIYGRKQRMPGLDTATPAHIAKCRINYPVQGSAADVVKRAMLRCQEMDLVVQVHDEVLVDGDEDIPEELEWIHPEVHTPFKVKIGPVWSG